MTVDFKDQVDRLAKSIADRISSQGQTNCQNTYEAGISLLVWLEYLRTSEKTGTADELIEGLRALIVESAGCLTVGIVRPALFALRGQIDVALSWLYFKDHPIEWKRVTETGDGFVLKKEALGYLENYYEGFKSRFSALKKNKHRSEQDPYRLLSAHVHSQSFSTLPTYGDLESIVATSKSVGECITLQSEVSEYLGDVFLSCFADKWASLPDSILNKAKERLGKDNIHIVFT
ncbi:hypothetical protein [Mesorhizobium sp. f-mel]